jgi:hypothetical protein
MMKRSLDARCVCRKGAYGRQVNQIRQDRARFERAEGQRHPSYQATNAALPHAKRDSAFTSGIVLVGVMMAPSVLPVSW